MEKTVTNGNNDARRGGEAETNAAPNNQGNNQCWFIIELSVQEVPSRVYIVQQSEHQFYHVRNLNNCSHYQLRGHEAMLNVINSMEQSGLVHLHSSEVTSNSSSFFTILTIGRNYFLPDITVINEQ